METIDHIPTTKISRASKLVNTGVKLGVNYVNYYTDKLLGDDGVANSKLHERNASVIFDGLKKLKGSALKVAQMLSMDTQLLPQAYIDKFSLAQFSVPPLSPPLVERTVKKYFGKSSHELFDQFDLTSAYAASIGQVHLAELKGEKLAVKIQYPGVAESISSDLAMVKPIAMRMFGISQNEIEPYFIEVKSKLVEETNYHLELDRSQEISAKCSNITGLKFPHFYPALSNEKVLTMKWMDGKHLSEFKPKSRAQSNYVGQALWDFYMVQLHHLKLVHADPHPGNFLVNKQGELVVLDFGCVKQIPEEFYAPYFELTRIQSKSQSEIITLMEQLEILRNEDSATEIDFYLELFMPVLELFTQPFQSETFDFSDPRYFKKITEMGQNMMQTTDLNSLDANRGSKHFIYVNRTFFGLFNLLHSLGADDIKINNYLQFIPNTFKN